MKRLENGYILSSDEENKLNQLDKVAANLLLPLIVLGIFVFSCLIMLFTASEISTLGWLLLVGSVCGIVACWRAINKQISAKTAYIKELESASYKKRAVCSKWENEIYEFVKEMCPDAVVSKNDRTVIPSKNENGSFLEIDIYIPEYMLGIEANGTRFHDKRAYETDWATSPEGARTKELYKTLYCKERGITLVHVWDDTPMDIIRKTLEDEIRKARLRRL